MNIIASSIDEVFFTLIKALLKRPGTDSRNGVQHQAIGTCVTITNPIDVILRNPHRNANPSYAAGELLWYLRQSGDLDIIQYYTRNYIKFSDDGLTLNGAYGPRLRDAFIYNEGPEPWSGHFLTEVIAALRNDPTTRRLYLPIYRGDDVLKNSKDIPCTTGLQFILDGNFLHLVVNMRSNDAWLGFPYDVFCFAAMQIIVAAYGGFKIGHYHHMVGSMHLYEKNLRSAIDMVVKTNEISYSDPLKASPLFHKEPLDKDLRLALKYEEEIRNGEFYPSNCELPEFNIFHQLVMLCHQRHNYE